MSARRADLLCVALLIGLAAVLFADVLFLGSNFAFRDLFLYHFPMKRVVHDLIARGEFPWWNPYTAGGQPMAANPAYEIFYPPQYLIFVGSYEYGFALHIVFHVWLALAGMFLFLRALPLGRAAAMFGAISFGLGGCFLGMCTTLPTMFVWSWAGLCGWAVLRWLRDDGSFALAAAAMAMPMLVGEPVALAQLWLLIFVGAWRHWKRIGLLALVAAGIAAVQLIPTIDHVRDSARSRGLTYANVVDWSMPPERPLELIAPNAFGKIDAEHPIWDAKRFAPRKIPYLLSIYCGLAVIALAAAGFVLRARGAAMVGAIALVSYLFAIGGHTPLFRFLYAIGVRSVRYPEKFIASGLVALVVFAAVVFDRLDLRGARVAAVVALVIAIVTLTGGWWSTAVLAAAWAVLLWFFRDTRVWRLAALALLFLDVGSFSPQPIPRLPRRFFTAPPIVAAFDRDRDAYAVFHRGAWNAPPNVKDLDAAAPMWTMRNSLRPDSPAAWGLRGVLQADIDETFLLPTHDLLDSMMRLGRSGFPRWSEPYALLSNVRYFVDYRTDGTVDAPVFLTRIPNQGRYWFAKQLSRHLVRPGSAIVRQPFVPAAGRILGLRETASSATLDVDAAGPAFLAITITRHKYWRAAIDGREAPLAGANIAYQGLVVPAGHHRIELRYRNPVVAWSAGVSGITLAAAVIAPIRRRRRLRNGS